MPPVWENLRSCWHRTNFTWIILLQCSHFFWLWAAFPLVYSRKSVGPFGFSILLTALWTPFPWLLLPFCIAEPRYEVQTSLQGCDCPSWFIFLGIHGDWKYLLPCSLLWAVCGMAEWVACSKIKIAAVMCRKKAVEFLAWCVRLTSCLLVTTGCYIRFNANWRLTGSISFPTLTAAYSAAAVPSCHGCNVVTVSVMLWRW